MNGSDVRMRKRSNIRDVYLRQVLMRVHVTKPVGLTESSWS